MDDDERTDAICEYGQSGYDVTKRLDTMRRYRCTNLACSRHEWLVPFAEPEAMTPRDDFGCVAIIAGLVLLLTLGVLVRGLVGL